MYGYGAVKAGFSLNDTTIALLKSVRFPVTHSMDYLYFQP